MATTKLNIKHHGHKFVLASLVLLLATIILGLCAKTLSPEPKVYSAKPLAASPELDYSGKPYGDAIDQAQTYLLANFNQITPTRRLILDYLQRKYGLRQQFSAAERSIKSAAPGYHDNPVEFRIYKRIAYPDDLASSLPGKLEDPMSQMLLESIYCDRLSLPADFQRLIQSNIALGGYNLTHVELSMKFLAANHCQPFSSSQATIFRTEIAPAIAALVENQVTTPDLRYEGVAFLLDMGRRDLVKSSWIDQILAEQQPGGGWKSKQDQTDSLDNDHSTVLALWTLLELSNPSAPDIPIIFPPTLSVK